MVSYILITGYSILLFINPLNFVAVILKVLLVNLLAALTFAKVFKKKRLENKKTLKTYKNVFYIYGFGGGGIFRQIVTHREYPACGRYSQP